MTTREKLDALLDQIYALPENAQAELVESLVEMRSTHLGIFHLNDEERAVIARSRDDVRQGRLVSHEEMNELFSQYGA